MKKENPMDGIIMATIEATEGMGAKSGSVKFRPSGLPWIIEVEVTKIQK